MNEQSTRYDRRQCLRDWSEVHLYRDRDMAGQDVEYGRTAAGLIDDLSQLLLGRIAFHHVIDTDRLEAIPDLVRQAEDALQIDIAFDAAFHRMKGDAARR